MLLLCFLEHSLRLGGAQQPLATQQAGARASDSDRTLLRVLSDRALQAAATRVSSHSHSQHSQHTLTPAWEQTV